MKGVFPTDGGRGESQSAAFCLRGVEPETFAGDGACELLEAGVQSCAVCRGGDTDGIAFVVRRGLGPEFSEGDGLGFLRGESAQR